VCTNCTLRPRTKTSNRVRCGVCQMPLPHRPRQAGEQTSVACRLPRAGWGTAGYGWNSTGLGDLASGTSRCESPVSGLHTAPGSNQADRHWAAPYAPGDVIRYTKGSRAVSVEAGEYDYSLKAAQTFCGPHHAASRLLPQAGLRLRGRRAMKTPLP
jgi:hypothetical protein